MSEDGTDISGADRGVWLVKVPKYMDGEWKKSDPKTEIGRLKITRSEGGKMEILFDSTDTQNLIHKPAAGNKGGKVTNGRSATATAATNDKDPMPETPKSHEFIVNNAHKNVSIFSVDQNSGKALVEGFVQQEGRFQPKLDKTYMNLTSDRFRRANGTEREVKILDRVTTGPKPVSQHKEDMLFERKKKEAGKRARDDKDQVISKLLVAFEKHQYYAMRDLEKLTNQPVPYLKEILKEIGIYNNKNKHKNLWELKPEYRHYDNNRNEPDN